MTPKIKQLLEMSPFRPFVLETTGGTRIEVQKPEWFFEVPHTEEFIVFSHGGYWICAYADLTRNIQVP